MLLASKLVPKSLRVSEANSAAARLSVNFCSVAYKLLKNTILNTENRSMIPLLLKITLGARSSEDEGVLYGNFPEYRRNSNVRKGVSRGIPRKLENHLREQDVTVNYTSRRYLPISVTYYRAEM